MNKVGKVSMISLFSLGALSLGLAHSAWADNSEPTAEDLKNSKTRGIFLKVPGNPAAFELQKANNDAAAAALKKSSTAIKARPKAVAKTTVKETTTKETTAASTSPAATKPAATTNTSKTATTTSKTTSTTTIKAGEAKHSKAPVKTASLTRPSHNEEAVVDDNAVIKAWLNKSGKHPNYKDGEKMQVSVKASKDCNLVIYDFDGKGTLTQIFPNEYQKEASLKAGETVTIGGDDSSFDFQVALAEGARSQQERLFVFAYPAKEDAPVSVAMNKVADSPFRSANMTLEQYRKLVNQSKVYFARSVKVLPKKTASSASGHDIQTVSAQLNDGDNAPNKTELSFSVEK